MFGAFRINALAKYEAPTGGGGIPTYSFANPSAYSINEDGTTFITFNFTTSNVAEGTPVYVSYLVNGVLDSGPFPSADIDSSNSVTVSGSAGVINMFAVADATTEGPQTVYCQLYTDAGRTQQVATSQGVTINDTSLATPSFTQVAFISSSLATATIPAASQAGDIAVLFDTSTTVTNTTPAGWTLMNGVTTTGIRTNVSYKQLAAGEPGTSITGMAGTTRKVILVFRPSSTVSSITPSWNTGQATTAAPTSQNLPLLTFSKPHIAFAVYAKTSTTVPTRGWTQTGGTPTESSYVNTSGVYIKWQINNLGSNPQNATISMTDAGTNTLQSGRISFT